jgi:hypothetical protein
MTIFSALPVIADIVVRTPTPAPQAVLPHPVATGALPFVTLAVAAAVILCFLRKGNSSTRRATTPADNS